MKLHLNPFLKLSLIVLMSFSLSSCLEKEEENEESAFDKDNQVPLELILENRLDVFSNFNPFNMKVGEYLHYRMNIKANSQGTAQTVADFESQFKSLCETDTEFKINFAYSFDFYTDEEEGVVKGYTVTVDKQSAKSALKGQRVLPVNMSELKKSSLTKQIAVFKNLGMKNISTRGISLDLDCEPTDEVVCLKFFDYELERYQKKAPDAVIQANCPGLEDCNLNITKQSFKQVVQVKGEKDQVIAHEVELAPEVPFFDVFFDGFWTSPTDAPIYSGLVSHCYSSWVPSSTEGQGDVYIKQCLYLKNYAAGEGADQCPAPPEETL